MISAQKCINLWLLVLAGLTIVLYPACAEAAEAVANRAPVLASPTELLRKAYMLMLQGHFQEAIRAQVLAVRSDRDSVLARRYLGYSLLKTGSPKEALEQLHLVVIMTAPTAFDCCAFGEACLETGHLHLAQAWFKNALRIEPDMVWAQVGLRRADWALKRYEAGLAGRSDAVEGNKMKVEPSPSGQEVPRNFGNNQSRNAWDAWRGVEKK